MTDLRDYQQPYARDPGRSAGRRGGGTISLLDAVRHVKPTILLGTSTVHGAFTKEVIETMSAGVERPIVFPISNPTSRIEAMPADVIAWSKRQGPGRGRHPRRPGGVPGRDLPDRAGQQRAGLPGAGPGHHRLRRVQGDRRDAAGGGRGGRRPGRRQRAGRAAGAAGENLRASSATTAVAVAQAAIADGVATTKPGDLVQAVQDAMWQPVYAGGHPS